MFTTEKLFKMNESSYCTLIRAVGAATFIVDLCVITYIEFLFEIPLCGILTFLLLEILNELKMYEMPL